MGMSRRASKESCPRCEGGEEGENYCVAPLFSVARPFFVRTSLVFKSSPPPTQSTDRPRKKRTRDAVSISAEGTFSRSLERDMFLCNKVDDNGRIPVANPLPDQDDPAKVLLGAMRLFRRPRGDRLFYAFYQGAKRRREGQRNLCKVTRARPATGAAARSFSASNSSCGMQNSRK